MSLAGGRPEIFAQAARNVLLYLCDRVLADPAALIREQEIGAAVFGRAVRPILVYACSGCG